MDALDTQGYGRPVRLNPATSVQSMGSSPNGRDCAALKAQVTSNVADADGCFTRSCLLNHACPQEVADAITEMVEQASQALDGVTEAAVSDKVETALKDLCKTLTLVAASVPHTKEGCANLLQALSEQGQRHGSDVDRQPLTPEELQHFMGTLKVMIGDVRAALTDVSRDEIEELVDVALTVARMLLSASQAAARRLREVADRDEQRHSLIIEDLEEETESTGPGVGHGSVSSSTSPSVVLLPNKRYLWRPIWPRLRGWLARPSLPPFPRQAATSLLHKSKERPATAIVLGAMATPVFLCSATVSVWMFAMALPGVLLGDHLVQQLYTARKEYVDNTLEGVLQAKRVLRGRSSQEAAMDSLRDPVGSASVAASVASWAATQTCFFSKAAWKAAPELCQNARSLWRRYQKA